MQKIYTIGYEGKTLEEFLKTLKNAGVTFLVDVRENPNSRKKGFSKQILSETLNNQDIKYKHFAKLGTPKDIRLEYQSSGNIDFLFEHYRNYLKQNPEYIDNLLDEIGDNCACLMCFEKLATQCHRLVITEYLFINHGAAIKHL
ncbi:DUF488 domain-containing protein [Syntrophomonas palmitatica]|uniref:DUF488 domain-containing protein n=1 Tax=Syntrophomonas palmitatica TaxID=402877 RepID=UPI0006D07755|nr:DUF488 domain-containing protein [Syntrophomonas palmitatica]